MTPRSSSLAALVLASALALGGCASGNQAAGTTGHAHEHLDSGHNAADVSFVSGMVMHHEGAVDMAADVRSHGASEKVAALAKRIEKAQKPEIDLMQRWLATWGADTSAGMSEMHSHHGSGTPDPMGMMSGAQSAALAEARGEAFDRMFLQLMIAHHEGAVMMAKQEEEGGRNHDALHLAEHIVKDQTAEIAEMKRLLQKS